MNTLQQATQLYVNTRFIHLINPTTEISTTIFTRDLKFGMAGDDVKALQVYLNNHSYIISSTGAGSPGKETEYFGSLTSSALARFKKLIKTKLLD